MYVLNLTRAGAYGNGSRRVGHKLAVVEFDRPPVEIFDAARRLTVDDAAELPGQWELMEDATLHEVLTALQNPDFVELVPITPEAEVQLDGSDEEGGDEESHEGDQGEADENGLSPDVLATSVDALDIDEDVKTALKEHTDPLTTVEQIVDFANAHNGLKKVKGIGPKSEQAVIAAIDTLAAK